MAIDTQAAVNALWGESVTYTRTGPGTTSTVTAGRHLDGEDEVRSSYGVYTVRRETFTLATDAIAFTPKLRDTVTPSGLPARVVTGVGGSPFLKFWKLSTAYPSLADDLDQVATVYTATPTPTAEGFRDPQLVTEAGVTYACRLQPDTRERELDAAGREVTRAKFVCVFGSAVTLSAGDAIEVSSVRYEVVSQGDIEELGRLTFASVERIS